MGLRDCFSGKPGKDRFARMMMEAVRRAGETRTFTYDRDEFCLRLEGQKGAVSNLSNLYQEYCAKPRAERKQFVQAAVRKTAIEKLDARLGAVAKPLPRPASRDL